MNPFLNPYQVSKKAQRSSINNLDQINPVHHSLRLRVPEIEKSNTYSK